MLNHIVLMGRLVRDPELRHTQSGIAVASFTLAVDRDYGRNEAGDRQTDFIDIVAWRNTAEFVTKYFSKGRMAVVSGRLQIRDWTDKDGNRRRAAEVVADNVYFGDSRRDGDSQNRASDSNSGSYQSSYGGSSYSGGQSYGGNQSYNGNQTYGQSYGGQSYTPPSGGSDFADLSDDDGDLPF